MSETPRGPGWWQASDNKWYPPEQSPYARVPFPPYQAYRATTTNGFAIASLVLGILWVGGLGAVLAIICGTVARRQIRQSAGAESGDGLAVAGLVLGWIGVAGALFYIVVLIALASHANTS